MKCKKIALSLIGLYFSIVGAFAQHSNSDTIYESKPLAFEEANIVSSYYLQDGVHSAVRGGLGDEHVMDLANGIDVKFVGRDVYNAKHTITAGIGIDYHTAASQAYVNKSGASKKDGNRIYPTIDWLKENEEKGSSFGLGLSYSGEYNYHSYGVNASFSQKTKHNGLFESKFNLYYDRVTQIYPSELIPVSTTAVSSASRGSKEDLPTSPRTTFSGSFTFSQVINSRMQASVNLDLVEQNGYLGLPFHRVYFNDGSEKVENLPANRVKLPIGFRLNYFAGDRFIIKSYYRFYIDQWGILAHTADLELPVKITPFFSVSPFCRFYTQTAADYFAAYGEHKTADQYFSSNYSLSQFSSLYMGGGIKLTPPSGILKTHLSSFELRYGHYTQTTELVSNMISMALQFK